MGTFFDSKAGEVKVWHLLLAVGVVTVLALVLHSMFSTQNMITTGNNGSFLKTSYFGPMSAEKKAEIAVNTDKAAAEAAAKS